MFGKGTIHADFGVMLEDADVARKALEAAGFSVTRDAVTETEVVLAAADVYATDTPDAEVQREHIARAERVLDELGIAYRAAGHGVVVQGGTSAHRWVEVVVAATGQPVVRVLAIDEAEAEAQRDQVAAEIGVPPDALEVRWED